MAFSDAWPAHPECRRQKGTLACLDSQSPLCEKCPWWTVVASPKDELVENLKACVFPQESRRTD